MRFSSGRGSAAGDERQTDRGDAKPRQSRRPACPEAAACAIWRVSGREQEEGGGELHFYSYPNTSGSVRPTSGRRCPGFRPPPASPSLQVAPSSAEGCARRLGRQAWGPRELPQQASPLCSSPRQAAEERDPEPTTYARRSNHSTDLEQPVGPTLPQADHTEATLG